MPDMAGTRGDQLLGVGLEKLHGVELAGAQRSGILGHRRAADAVEAIGIDAGAPEIVGEADPRRRYL